MSSAAPWLPEGTTCLLHRSHHLDTPDLPEWYVDLTDPDRGAMATGRPRDFVDWYLQHCHPHARYTTCDRVSLLGSANPAFVADYSAFIAHRTMCNERHIVHHVETCSWVQLAPLMEDAVDTRLAYRCLQPDDGVSSADVCCMACAYHRVPARDWMEHLHLTPQAEAYLLWVDTHYSVYAAREATDISQEVAALDDVLPIAYTRYTEIAEAVIAEAKRRTES